MNEFFVNSTYFGVVLSLLCYWGALKISAKVKSTLVNPLCLACAFIIAFLLIFKIDYETFDNLADDFRSLCNEKTYAELEEAYILMQAEKEELENELECLREANEILRGR